MGSKEVPNEVLVTPSKSWKKARQLDLEHVVSEIKDLVETPALLLLKGPLGAGKTTLVQYFDSSVGFASPTYSLVQEGQHIAHADLYRLESADDLVPLELELYAEQKDYFLIEWGHSYLPELERMFGQDFSFYEIQIDIPENSHAQEVTRNYCLRPIET